MSIVDVLDPIIVCAWAAIANMLCVRARTRARQCSYMLSAHQCTHTRYRSDLIRLYVIRSRVLYGLELLPRAFANADAASTIFIQYAVWFYYTCLLSVIFAHTLSVIHAAHVYGLHRACVLHLSRAVLHVCRAHTHKHTHTNTYADMEHTVSYS